MEQNPFIAAYRQVLSAARRHTERYVRLEVADPDSPAPSAVGRVLHVGHQRIGFPAPPEPPPPYEVPDTGWQTLTLLAGFTAGTGGNTPQWRVRDGIVFWRGRITRDAGNWQPGFNHCANIPAAAQPTGLHYTSGMARSGIVLAVAIDHRLQVLPRTATGATNEIELGSIPPYLAAGS